MEIRPHIEYTDDDSLKSIKKSIRRKVLQARDEMLPSDREKASLLVTERMLGHQWFYGSENILCFASFGSEIDTQEIIKEALRSDKKVYLPRISGSEMIFYKINSTKELVPGFKGIPEPDGSGEIFRYQEADAPKTVMIMPGVAFDPLHRRIGYGKGYYDKYLWDKAGLCLRTIAIGFACQMVDEVPQDNADVRPYQLILL